MRLLNEVLRYIYHKNNIEYVLKKMANRKINHHHHQQQEVRLEAKKTVVVMAYNEQQRTKGPTTPTHTHHTADTNRNGCAATWAT